MKSKVILIEPLDFNDLRPGLFTRGNALEPYALECLASVLEEHNYEVDVLQQGSSSITDLIAIVAESRPFCVGLSVMTHTSEKSIQIARAIKRVVPHAYIVVGGQHPSLVPEYVLEESIDYAVLGEGEDTLPDLLSCLEGRSKRSVLDVPGIAFRGEDGQLVLTKVRPRICDLDSLPPPKRYASYLRAARSWNLTYPPPSGQVAVAQVSYSRGCRFRCTFCVSPRLWDGRHDVTSAAQSVTYRSARSVAKEVRRLHDEFGVNFLYFTDLTFNADLEKVRELCRAFIDEGLHNSPESSPGHLWDSVHWFALLKVGIDEETACLMAKAGCSKIGMGVESFDAALVHTFKKPYRGLDILSRSLIATDSAGIINRGLLIIGAPDETEESIERTINGLKTFLVDQVRVAFLTPYPNTPAHAQFAGQVMTNDYSLYDEEHPVIEGRFLTVQALRKARERIVNDFYGSTEYRERCRRKLDRFPWLKESYAWYFNDLYNQFNGDVDLRSLA